MKINTWHTHNFTGIITSQNEEVTANEHISGNNTWPSSQRCIYRMKVTSYAFTICIYRVKKYILLMYPYGKKKSD
jgi:hypothetical protein